jgi:hypothetical protein
MPAEKKEKAAYQVFPENLVRVPIQEKYVFPEKCVVCGATPGEKSFLKVTLQKSNPSLFTSAGWYEISFPICADCNRTLKIARKKSRASCLPGALTGVGGFILVLLLTHYNFIGAMLAGAFLVILSWIFYSWLVDRNTPPAIIKHYQRIRLAVKIVGFQPAPKGEDPMVDIGFASSEYARLFASLNKGEELQ